MDSTAMVNEETRDDDEFMDDAELDDFAEEAGLFDAWEEVEDAAPTNAADYDGAAEDEEEEESFAEDRTRGERLSHARYYKPINKDQVRRAAVDLDKLMSDVKSKMRDNDDDAEARKAAFTEMIDHLRSLVEAFGLEFTEPVLGESWECDGRGALILGHFMSDVPAHDSKNLKKRQDITTRAYGKISVVVARVWNEWCRALGQDAWNKVSIWNVVPYKAHAHADSPKGHKGKPLVSDEMRAMLREFQLIERGVRFAISLLRNHTIVTFGERAAEFIERSRRIKDDTATLNTATAHICYLRAHGVRREKDHSTRVFIRQEHYAAFGKAVDDILAAPAIARALENTELGAEGSGTETIGTIAAKAFMHRTMAKMDIQEIDGEFHAYTREEAKASQKERAREYARKYANEIYVDCFLGGPNSKFTRLKFRNAQALLKSRVPYPRHMAKNFLCMDPRKFRNAQALLKSRVPYPRHMAKNFLCMDPQKFRNAQRLLKSRVPYPQHMQRD